MGRDADAAAGVEQDLDRAHVGASDELGILERERRAARGRCPCRPARGPARAARRSASWTVRRSIACSTTPTLSRPSSLSFS